MTELRIPTAKALVALSLLAGAALAGPLWDYVNAPDPNFSWYETDYRVNNTGWKGKALAVLG